MNLQLFSPCPRGLESLLEEELRDLSAHDIKPTAGGVAFKGDWALVYRVNLYSRIATRVLWQVAHGRYQNEGEIFKLAYATTWAKWFTPEQTIRIFVTSVRSKLKSLNFTTLRVKDGICDHFRAVAGKRPSVNTEAPDIRIHAFIDAQTCTLYLDTSGEPLYKRGFKHHKVEAPLKENLAAGIIMLAGWDKQQPLLDPMCGSGTFLIEAAQMALNIAPGLGRHFAFEQFKNFDAPSWEKMREAAQAACEPVRKLPIYGADIDARQIKASNINLEAAGLGEVVSLTVSDILELIPPQNHGVLITNPPYGVRLGTGGELETWYPKIGDQLKKAYANWRCYFLSADTAFPKYFGLKASRRVPLFNGDLDCRLYEYVIVDGSMRRRKTDQETSD